MKFVDIITILGRIDVIMGEVDCWNDNWYTKSTRYQFFIPIGILKEVYGIIWMLILIFTPILGITIVVLAIVC